MKYVIRSSEILSDNSNFYDWVDAVVTKFNPKCPGGVITFARKALDRMEDCLYSDFEDYPDEVELQESSAKIASITIDYTQLYKRLPVLVVMKTGQSVNVNVSVSDVYFALANGSEDYPNFPECGFDMAEEIVTRATRRAK